MEELDNANNPNLNNDGAHGDLTSAHKSWTSFGQEGHDNNFHNDEVGGGQNWQTIAFDNCTQFDVDLFCQLNLRSKFLKSKKKQKQKKPKIRRIFRLEIKIMIAEAYKFFQNNRRLILKMPQLQRADVWELLCRL